MTSIRASNNNPRSFCLLTFGCQMNVGDSGWLAAALKKRGFSELPAETASLIILNTCSVREKPEKKVINMIRQLTGSTRPEAMIAVLGCVAQQCGESLFEASPKVRLVAGPDALAQVPDALGSLEKRGQRMALLEFSRIYAEREEAEGNHPSGTAFVTIMQGCDNFCSYCIVPFTRGRQKSRPAQDILAECERLLQQGVTELTLLGQNVNAWRDSRGAGFASLLKQVSQLDGLRRMRFRTSHPADFSEEMIEFFAGPGPVCPELHLPLQSGSDPILAAMRRRYTAAGYIDLTRALKRARPDIALSTDLIVGFPGESEQDFQDTLAVMRECGFASSYSFCYSDRPGTRASLMPEKIAREISADRLARLQSLQDELTGAWLDGRKGEETEILIEAPSPRGPSASWQGRDPYGACVHVRMPKARDWRGSYVRAAITEAKKHCLVARRTES